MDLNVRAPRNKHGKHGKRRSRTLQPIDAPTEVVTISDGELSLDDEVVFVKTTKLPEVKTRRGRKIVEVDLSESESTDVDQADVIQPQESPSKPAASSSSSSSKPEDPYKCAICLDTFVNIKNDGKKIVSTKCGHIFCEECLKDAIKSTKMCPTCRIKLTLKQFHTIFL